ncbi:L-ascorbate metabolism protein UlaG, beta-lactamase superfamily [Singulisphaera sp. GP187]|uniref:MBL fold metallo-hydrolase n=1 Tax=Singulisphaera sp. GP187 TaxID=1882752 RepID=UPI00092BEB7D|nr:MBL fold metallo-hydrolase [Singulisphaera sp. GP187]SIO64778.1 L-ascorbate metabolism protein UlaG, beta-lactamase superfamily [Singulisphaera sp. GP187]
MRITWYGHAAFLIETEGRRIILDPFRSPDSGGYEPIDEPADLVVVSHENDRYHSHLGQIRPPFQVLKALDIPPEGETACGIHFETVRVYETPERKPEDEVTIVHFRVEGLHVVFLGDLGHALDASDLKPLRAADIVLAATGGPPTIALAELAPLIDAVGPRLVLPMHYKTPKINLNIQPVERFLETMPETPVDRPGRTWLEVTRATLPESRTIVILDHAR